MTHLRQLMLEELRRRNYAESTIHAYIRTVEHFAGYFHCPPDQLGLEHICRYQAAMFTRWKLAPNTVTQRLAALRFLYIQVLKRGWSAAETQCTHYERTPAFGAEAGCGAGALPPHPQDFALWCLSRCGLCAGRQMKGGWRSIPLDRSRPLSRRSGCFPAFPYPPLSPG